PPVNRRLKPNPRSGLPTSPPKLKMIRWGSSGSGPQPTSRPRGTEGSHAFGYAGGAGAGGGGGGVGRPTRKEVQAAAQSSAGTVRSWERAFASSRPAAPRSGKGSGAQAPSRLSSRGGRLAMIWRYSTPGGPAASKA